MASTTITLNDVAYERLKGMKRPGESFSDVIIHHIHPPAETAGDLLDRISAFEGKGLVDEERMAKVEKGRKRRSPRS